MTAGLSYWERESFLRYDAAVIGAGITGLSTAAALKERYPERSVAVFERELLPTGASTRNAGFGCFGSLTELLYDRDRDGREAMLKLAEQRWRGLNLLRKRLGDTKIDYKPCGSYELLSEKELPAADRLAELNDDLRPIFGADVFSMCSELTGRFGFNADYVRGLCFNRYEGSLDTGRMMRTLWQYAAEKGVMILTGAEVTAVESDASGVRIDVNGTVFRAEQAAVCTNAFTPKLLPAIDLLPGRGQVILTAPVADLPFEGLFHFDEGFYYFRTVGRRVLFGGGRNLDLGAETTDSFETTALITGDLQDKLRTIILPGQSLPAVEQSWAGVMAFGDERRPVVRQLDERLFIGVRMGGMGVAIGSDIGRQLAELMQ